MEKTMKKTFITMVTVGLVSTSAFAANTAVCAGCHGANFEKVALGKSKIVKDMKKADIVAALKGYKDGSYGGAMKATMKGQVANLSDADIEEIAAGIAGGGDAAPKAAEANKTAAAATAEKATEATKTATDAVKEKVSETADKAKDAAHKAMESAPKM